MSSGAAKRARRGQKLQVDDDDGTSYKGAMLKAARRVGHDVADLRLRTLGKAAAEKNLAQQNLDLKVELKQARRTIYDLKWVLGIVVFALAATGVVLILEAIV